MLAARKDLPGDTLPDFIAYVRANQAKMQYGSAGVGTSSHVASFADVATADEQGPKGFDVSAWNALFVPKGAPLESNPCCASRPGSVP